MAQPKKKSSVGTTIVCIVFAAVLIVGVYLSLTRDRQKNAIEADAEVAEVTTLISRDLDKDYPATVREVMKYYCRITKCIYSEELSDSQMTKLVDKLRGLYSDDLLAQNDRTEMIGLVKPRSRTTIPPRPRYRAIMSRNPARSHIIEMRRLSAR